MWKGRAEGRERAPLERRRLQKLFYCFWFTGNNSRPQQDNKFQDCQVPAAAVWHNKSGTGLVRPPAARKSRCLAPLPVAAAWRRVSDTGSVPLSAIKWTHCPLFGNFYSLLFVPNLVLDLVLKLVPNLSQIASHLIVISPPKRYLAVRATGSCKSRRQARSEMPSHQVPLLVEFLQAACVFWDEVRPAQGIEVRLRRSTDAAPA